ncbi:acyltransferase family protein [Rhizosaccharibacter radicis]|uniref:Acyltransferase n=1 Tax=Rhizosaccharibacter radicis TaxID=2782605 RepID=A0ABT1VV99_9PROT|nr:acyltransferase [Acetobacteraceae bacterium KSS12]
MRHNNFDALRLVAALMVVHGHGWMLAGGPVAGLWNLPFHHVGLDIFFSISGYLVTGSWQRDPRFRDFLLKRALRILPGLAACVLVTVLVLGPAVTVMPVLSYLSSGLTWLYLTNMGFLLQLRLPGVFGHAGPDDAVNGSLWSLMPEFCCYLTVPLLALLQGRTRHAALLALAAVAGGISIVLFHGHVRPWPLVWNIDPKYALAEVPFFAVGGLYFLLEDRLVRAGRADGLWRTDLCLTFLIGNYVFSGWFGWGNLPFEWLTLPYLVISFGRMSLPVLRRAGRFGDASYGVYLYAFPIQQLVLEKLPGDRFPVVTCAILSIAAGLVSWHLVERPALRLASRLVRRPRLGLLPAGTAA